MLNIANHQRNANQNHNEISSHTYQKGYNQKRTQITCWCCWWECKSVQPLWKAVWSFLKKLKVDPPYHPAILPECVSEKKQKQKYEFKKNTCTLRFIAALFSIANIWKQPKCPSIDE